MGPGLRRETISLRSDTQSIPTLANSAGKRAGLYFEAATNLWSQSMNRRLTAIIEREGDGFVALCPELDVASQGGSIEEARDNLREALELFFETASPTRSSDAYLESSTSLGRGRGWLDPGSSPVKRRVGILEQNGFIEVRRAFLNFEWVM
jgi:predicted RNase H-like HicB family nuclease